MSAGTESIKYQKTLAMPFGPAWLWIALGLYVLILLNGNGLLNDSDTFWQIAVGQSILDHGSWPHTDIYSFTKAGEPWTSSSWLAQVLFAGAYQAAGWAGVVALTAASAALAVALLVSALGRKIPSAYAIAVGLIAFGLLTSHLLARPHILALPAMIVWTQGLIGASERKTAPSFWLLPVITLWANLHGGFVFGFVLVVAFAFDAWWNADPVQKTKTAARWAIFGACALAASCVTPYGPGSILAANKILSLGSLLRLISEWHSVDFGEISAFSILVLGLIAAILTTGVKLPFPRMLIAIGLLYMALSHIRNIEIFVFLMPLIVETPVAQYFGLRGDVDRTTLQPLAAVAALIIMGTSTWAIAADRGFSPPREPSPAAAVNALQDHGASRILNDLFFSGYLISRGIPVFIDGRAELYGEKFGLTYYHALQLEPVDSFLDLLKTYRIDAVLLPPSTPAVGLLDRTPGWSRVYADANAVAYLRSDAAP